MISKCKFCPEFAIPGKSLCAEHEAEVEGRMPKASSKTMRRVLSLHKPMGVRQLRPEITD